MAITHTFVSAKPIAADPTEVGSAEWNAAHTVSIVDADVAIAAAIAESKLALNFATHAAVTLDANADTVLSLSTQALGLDTQTANKVFASAVSGGAAVPAFRALVAADVPALSYTTITIDTLANILASAATVNKVAYATTYSATDTTRVDKFLIADGTNWKIQEPALATIANGIDMGAVQDNSRTGYGDGYITGLQIVNNTSFQIPQDSTSTLNGSLRIDTAATPDEFEVYLRSLWNTVIYDGTYASGDFRHTPLTEAIYVWRGDSVALGLNGRNIIQEYNVSMGAYPAPRVLYGGTF